MGLAYLLAREQGAFLRRDRATWGEHLAKTRDFLGEGLAQCEPGRSVLILGAGSGLEVPWPLAPRGTVGWDGDPWSRVRTLLRHRRFPPWIFEDLTGGLEELQRVARRSVLQVWSGRRRPTELAARRLAGLLASMEPNPVALRKWIESHRPGTILAANVMGQFGVVARRLVEGIFEGALPWQEDPEVRDPLEEALDLWTARAIRAFLAALQGSGAGLWLVHDRGVVFSGGSLALGPEEPSWTSQLKSDVPLEVSDPLCGVDVLAEVKTYHFHRWLWNLAPGQRHLIEAVMVPPIR